METTKLFVALSHTLTPSQIDGFTAQYGVQSSLSDEDIEEMGLQEAYELPYKFVTTSVTLKEVALELQQRMSNIPATAGLSDIQTLAKAIVAEAVKAGATHFYCVGEPTLTMWANLYAGGHDYTVLGAKKPLICIQSTTERRSTEVTNPDGTVTKTATFNHVQWRELF